MKISKTKKKIKKQCFFLMSQGSFNPKIRFLGQNGSCSRQTDGQTHTKVTTVRTLSGFQEVFLQPIIKDRSNNNDCFDQKHVH